MASSRTRQDLACAGRRCEELERWPKGDQNGRVKAGPGDGHLQYGVPSCRPIREHRDCAEVEGLSDLEAESESQF